MDIFALDELLQAGKNFVPGCENDCKRALSTGFVKQFRLHGRLQYSWPCPPFSPASLHAFKLPKMLSFLGDRTSSVRLRRCRKSSGGSPTQTPLLTGRTTIVSLATTSFGSVLATSLVE